MGLFNIRSVARYQTKRRVDRLWTLKLFEKKTKNEKGVSKKLSKKKTKMRILKSHSAENSEKKGTLWDFLNILSVAKYQKIERRTLWGHLKNFEKSLTKPKSLIVPKKVRNLCFGILVKKLAHTHGFDHETSGLKSKHLTTRPRTRETCELPREIRELSRGKKSTRTFP